MNQFKIRASKFSHIYVSVMQVRIVSIDYYEWVSPFDDSIYKNSPISNHLA